MTIDDIKNKKTSPVNNAPVTPPTNPVEAIDTFNKLSTTNKPAETKTEAPKMETPKVTSSQELIDVLNAVKPDEAKLKAEQQKLARDKLFASLNRGISNLSNLYFTTQYAPAVKQSTGLSEYYQQRYDKLQDDYKNDLYKYANARLAQVKNKQDEDYQNAMIDLKYNQYANEEARKNAERQEESALNELEAINKMLENEYLPKEQELKLKNLKASVEQKLASARASNASASRTYAGMKADEDKNSVYWPIDERGTQVKIPKSKLTKTNISQIYKALGGPETFTDMEGNTKPVTQDQMEQFIGRNIGNSGSGKARRLVNNLAGKLGTSNYSEFE